MTNDNIPIDNSEKHSPCVTQLPRKESIFILTRLKIAINDFFRYCMYSKFVVLDSFGIPEVERVYVNLRLPIPLRRLFLTQYEHVVVI